MHNIDNKVDRSSSSQTTRLRIGITHGHRLVLLSPAAPLAPLVVALGLAPWGATSLRSSLRASVTSNGNAGCGISASGSASGGTIASSRNAGAVTRVCGAIGSRSAVLSSAVLRGSGTSRGRAGAVELTLDECESVLAVLSAVALVGGLIAAVTAVGIGAVAVRLHLGAGLSGIVSMISLAWARCELLRRY
jgi:hypothetical protein